LQIKERIADVERLNAQAGAIKSVSEGTKAHVAEMQRLKQLGGKAFQKP
jgi:hypothetical protein